MHDGGTNPRAQCRPRWITALKTGEVANRVARPREGDDRVRTEGVAGRPRSARSRRRCSRARRAHPEDKRSFGLGKDASIADTRQVQKPGKCRGDAHAVPPCKPLTFKQPAACTDGRRRVAHQRATSRNFLRPGKTCSGMRTGSNRHHIDAGRPHFVRDIVAPNPVPRGSSPDQQQSYPARATGGRGRAVSVIGMVCRLAQGRGAEWMCFWYARPRCASTVFGSAPSSIAAASAPCECFLPQVVACGES